MPQGIILELVLLVLCVLAAVLGSAAVTQRRAPVVARRAADAAGATYRPARTPADRQAARVSPADRGMPGGRAERPAAARPAVRLLRADAACGTEAQLATAISSLYAIARSEDAAAAKIAERTVPRLQDYREPLEARLHLARHRLALLSLGREPQAARIAAQCLAALGGA